VDKRLFRLSGICFLAIIFVFFMKGTSQAAGVLEMASSSCNAKTGDIIQVNITVNEVSDLYSAELHLLYDPETLEAVGKNGESTALFYEGNVFVGNKFVVQNQIKNHQADYAITMLGNRTAKDEGVIASLYFKITKEKSTEIKFNKTILLDKQLQVMTLNKESCMVNADVVNETEQSVDEKTDQATVNIGLNSNNTNSPASSSQESAAAQNNTKINQALPPQSITTQKQALENNKGFADIEKSWASAAIINLVSKGYVKGFPDGKFYPDQSLTRAEFICLIDHIYQLGSVDKNVNWQDLSQTHWAYNAIQRAASSGIISGYQERFRPDNAISRAEMATVLAKLLKISGNQALLFSDAKDIPLWSQSYISALAAQGLLTGYPDGSFQPQRFVTRAEICQLLNQVLEQIEAKPVAS